MELLKNALQSGGVWKRRAFVFVWTENISKTKLFENDDVTIITWFSCPSFHQTQIQGDRWRKYVTFSNFFAVVLTTGPKHPEQRPVVAFCWVVVALIYGAKILTHAWTSLLHQYCLGNDVNRDNKVKQACCRRAWGVGLLRSFLNFLC